MAYLDFFRRLGTSAGGGDEAYNNLYGATDPYKPSLPPGRGVGVSMGTNMPQGLNAPLQSADPGPDDSMDRAVESVASNVRAGLLARGQKPVDRRPMQEEAVMPPSENGVMGVAPGQQPSDYMTEAFKLLFGRRK
jgi:hypothetical protein